MANAILAFPNRVDADFFSVAFSGGNWLPSLPLTNLQNPLLQRVARSTNATAAATQFIVDLGVERDIKVIAIPSHNMTDVGRYRITGSNVSNFSTTAVVIDLTDVWGIIYPFGSLTFEHESWWTGTIAPEQQANYPMPILHVFEETIVARYWKFEFIDEANPDGYIELSRLFMSPGWQPSVNMQYGAGLGWQDDTLAETSLGGTDFYDERVKRRVARFNIAQIELDEALTNPFEMQRELGISRQLFFVYDPDDVAHKARRSFLATMRTLSPIEHISFDRGQVAFELREVK